MSTSLTRVREVTLSSISRREMLSFCIARLEPSLRSLGLMTLWENALSSQRSQGRPVREARTSQTWLPFSNMISSLQLMISQMQNRHSVRSNITSKRHETTPRLGSAATFVKSWDTYQLIVQALVRFKAIMRGSLDPESSVGRRNQLPRCRSSLKIEISL